MCFTRPPTICEMSDSGPPTENDLGRGILWGSIFVGATLIGDLVIPKPLSDWIDWLFEPGAYLPRSYWGGYQEFPLPLLVLLLNWFFYCAVFGLAFRLLRKGRA